MAFSARRIAVTCVPPEILAGGELADAPPLRPLRDQARSSPADIGLTDRQPEVLALNMQGKNNKTICRILDLAEPTVKNLTASFQPEGLQVWTGCIARTAPGWSLLVRGSANFPKSLSYQTFEGIIETDKWFGPLFDNIRILKTDVPVEFRRDIPFLQVQPVRKETHSDKLLQNYVVKDMAQLSTADWEAFHRTVVSPNTMPTASPDVTRFRLARVHTPRPPKKPTDQSDRRNQIDCEP